MSKDVIPSLWRRLVITSLFTRLPSNEITVTKKIFLVYLPDLRQKRGKMVGENDYSILA
jgi:hypothetical protein